MLKRFRPDDPEFLAQLEARLRASLHQAGSETSGLLSVTLAVPEIPFAAFPVFSDPSAQNEVFYWSRPAAGLHLLGMGVVVEMQAAGVERWCLLKDAMDGWKSGWRHEDPDATGLQPLILGGFSFSPEGGGPALPPARFRVPALLLRRKGEYLALTFSFSPASGGIDLDAAMRRLRQLAAALAQPPAPPGESQALTRRRCESEDAAWLARVASAVSDIQSGGLDKVVLTRRVTVSSPQPFDPARIMATLAQRHPRSTLFGVGTPDGGVFMGASPELLAGLHHGEAYCDALAGTAWGPGGARPLLDDVKNGREHRLVVQSIAEALRPVCSRLEVPAAPVALHLGNLHHLWSGLRGRVKPGIGLLHLLERLHPTPAVGGYPRQAALDWLVRHEENRSGWYTGAIGWMDMAGEGEFTVALRCGRIQENQAELYAGAGIVAGSNPARELAETEAKLAPMLDALGGSGYV